MMATINLVLVTVWFLKLPLISSSKTDYCEIVPKRHFLCEDEAKSGHIGLCNPNSIIYPRNTLDKTNVLNALNDIRTGVANGKLQIGHPKFTPPQAANMYELKWDNECERAARNIAKYCYANPQFYGNFSNIFARFEAGLFLDLGFYSVKDNITAMDDLLWHRIKSADYPLFQDIDLSSGSIIGKRTTSFYAPKLSILVKAEVSVVGCSMMIQDLGSNIDCILACVFGGISTWDVPLYLYEKGLPCSLCPVGSQCSTAFPGLCECKGRCFSYSKDVKKSGFYNFYAIVVDKDTKEDEIVPLEDLNKESYESTYRYFHTTAPTTTSILTSIATTATTTLTTTIKSPVTNLPTTTKFSTMTKLSTTVELPTITELVTTGELTTIKKLPTTIEFPTITELPTKMLRSTTEQPEQEKTTELQITTVLQKRAEVTIKKATSQALAINHFADYEVDYEQNFEPVAMVTSISSPTNNSIARPSAYTSSGSSLNYTYFNLWIMFVTETIVHTLFLTPNRGRIGQLKEQN